MMQAELALETLKSPMQNINGETTVWDVINAFGAPVAEVEYAYAA